MAEEIYKMDTMDFGSVVWQMGLFRIKHGVPDTITVNTSWHYTALLWPKLDPECQRKLVDQGVIGYLFGTTIRVSPDVPQMEIHMTRGSVEDAQQSSL